MQQKKHLVFVHLLNDYSGSPMVLSHILQGLGQSNQYNIDVYTSNATKNGMLSNIPGINYFSFYYKWSANPLVRLFYFTISQIDLFFKIVKQYKYKNVTLYINTILPFGAALAGKFCKKKVVYHVHEAFVQPRLLSIFLKSIIKFTANKAAYVSPFLYKAAGIKNINHTIIPNTLSKDFCASADAWLANTNSADKEKFIVLMVCSLKKYKGVDEFLKISNAMPSISFELLINESKDAIVKYFSKTSIPNNVTIYSQQNDVHPFYRNASVVINLTNHLVRVETFGMTILEGMYYKLPVIVPIIGGIAELVDEGDNGFKCSSMDIENICSKIELLQTNKILYNKMSLAARKKADLYNFNSFIKSVKGLVD